MTVAARRKHPVSSRDSGQPTGFTGRVRSYRAGHARHPVTWTRDAGPSDDRAAGQGDPPADADAGTPSLMETFAMAEQRIAQRLGDPAGLETTDAKRRLEILLSAQRQAAEIEDRSRRNNLDHERRRDEDRRASAAGWLQVARRAARFGFGVAGMTILIGTLVELCVTGRLDAADIGRLLP